MADGYLIPSPASKSNNLYLAQSEKNAAVTQFVQALRGYWTTHFRLRLVTLFDFQAGEGIR